MQTFTAVHDNAKLRRGCKLQSLWGTSFQWNRRAQHWNDPVHQLRHDPSCVHSWPDVTDVTLWSLAVLNAVCLMNRIPREDMGRSPLELFSRKTWPTYKLQDLNVRGCPAYVLDWSLASGRQIPCWQPHSSRLQYVGSSAPHGHGVPLVLSLDTGKVTAQYHMVFDNWF